MGFYLQLAISLEPGTTRVAEISVVMTGPGFSINTGETSVSFVFGSFGLLS
jgi:hypothetical protein